jgi:putative ABC transport system permease protein
VGIVGLGDADGFAGATLAVFDLDTATRGARLPADTVDGIDIQMADGADLATVQRPRSRMLPPRTEVITGEQVAEEAADQASTSSCRSSATGLLIFAFITAFVSAFIINNVFAITIGQRLRELALLRAVGASGQAGAPDDRRRGARHVDHRHPRRDPRRHRRRRLLITLFNAAGAGFPPTGTVLAPRTIVIASSSASASR